MFLKSLELFWQLRITNPVRVKIGDAHAHPMFHFACAKIMQEWSPLFVFFEVFGDMFRKEDMSGVAAIHHPLRHVEAGAREVGMTIHINHAARRTAVHTHPKL